MIVNMQMQCDASRGLTSISVLSLQAFSIHYMDLSDQLRVATHPRPTCLRRVIQIQLSGKERVFVIKLLKQAGVRQAVLHNQSNEYAAKNKNEVKDQQQ